MRALSLIVIGLTTLSCSSQSDSGGTPQGTGGASHGTGGSGANASGGVGTGATGNGGSAGAGAASGGGGSSGVGGGCTQCQNGDFCCAPGCDNQQDDDCPVAGGPVVLYTDITSGPNQGGEDGDGAYLSIFGKGFGSDPSQLKVTVGGGEVAKYLYLGPSLGRADVQQLSVQLGAATATGAVRVEVAGVPSNADHVFTVRSGDIYYVALDGDDSSGVVGDPSHPFRTPQDTLDRDDFGQGDFLVLRAGSWTDSNMYSAVVSVAHKSGSAAEPIAVMAYPGESVVLDRAADDNGVTAWDTAGGFVVAGFRVKLSGPGTPIGWPPGASPNGNLMTNVRVVNNELSGMLEYSGGSAAIAGRGQQIAVLGNHVHDNGGSKLYHAVYFDNNDDTGTSKVQIAFNHIENQRGGRGIQIYNSGSSGISDITIYGNLIHDIALDGILFGDSTTTGCLAYDNVVYRTAVPSLQEDGASGGCIRVNNDGLQAKIYNNTFVDCAVDGDSDSAAIRLDQAQDAELINNLVASSGGNGYLVGPSSAHGSNNLWSGSGAAPSWDSAAIGVDPQFVSGASHDFHLSSSSPALGAGSGSALSLVPDDFDGNPRPQGNGFDIGAFER